MPRQLKDRIRPARGGHVGRTPSAFVSGRTSPRPALRAPRGPCWSCGRPAGPAPPHSNHRCVAASASSHPCSRAFGPAIIRIAQHQGLAFTRMPWSGTAPESGIKSTHDEDARLAARGRGATPDRSAGSVFRVRLRPVASGRLSPSTRWGGPPEGMRPGQSVARSRWFDGPSPGATHHPPPPRKPTISTIASKHTLEVDHEVG